MKEIYDGMDDLLSRTAVIIARTIPSHLDINLNVIYFPQLGFHITMPLDLATGQVAYEGGDEQWERMFTTENQAYYKDFRMREMDETLGDMYALICGESGNCTARTKGAHRRSEKEIEITYDLAQKVLEYEKTLVAASDVCGELDR